MENKHIWRSFSLISSLVSLLGFILDYSLWLRAHRLLSADLCEAHILEKKKFKKWCNIVPQSHSQAVAKSCVYCVFVANLCGCLLYA